MITSLCNKLSSGLNFIRVKRVVGITKMSVIESEKSDADSALEEELQKVTSNDRPESVPRNPELQDFSVSKDITGESRCKGNYSDFAEYFRDRYRKMEKLFRERGIKTTSIEGLTGGRTNEVTVVGLVAEVRTTQSDNEMVTLEDPTGTMRAVFTDNEIREKTQKIVEDEVVAVEGQLSDNGEIIFGDDIIFPEIPVTYSPNTADRDVKAVLISDTHFGAENFQSKSWNFFVDWIRQQGDIEYLLIAGDLVEGIGVYPGQRDELSVVDIYDQYKLCAEAFRDLPEDMQIIASVGNHDSVRLAEPQPRLREEFTHFFPDNVELVGNPAMVNVEGVKFLLYHGMSLMPIISQLPDMDIQEPQKAMVPLMEKRHLAPMYGDVRIAPEEEDYLVIDEIPDILHSGHVHTFGIDEYNSVQVVNTGTWQGQTDYQISRNVDPDVAYAPVVDLKTLDIDVKHF